MPMLMPITTGLSASLLRLGLLASILHNLLKSLMSLIQATLPSPCFLHCGSTPHTWGSSTSGGLPTRARVQAHHLFSALVLDESAPRVKDHHSSGCLPAEKFPTFASGRQGRGPVSLLNLLISTSSSSTWTSASNGALCPLSPRVYGNVTTLRVAM